MLSLRSAFFRFILSGVICCAIVLGLPTDAHAEWINITSENLHWVTNVSESSFSSSSLPSWSTVASNYSSYYPTGSGAIKFALYASTAGSNIQTGEHFRIGVLGAGSVTFSYGASYGTRTEVTRGTRNYKYYCSNNGNSWTELAQDSDGYYYSSNVQPVYIVAAFTVVSTPNMSSYDYKYMVLPSLNVFKDMPDQTFEGVIEDQTEQLTDTEGSDTVTSDVTSQYTQQVEGLQLFQFVENLDETFANTLTTQETDSSVSFPGMNLAGFQIPAANVDPLQLVPPDLVTPIKMIVTFTFCSAFVSHIISLLHAIFEIYDYANGVWVDTVTEGDRVTSAVTLSGWE